MISTGFPKNYFTPQELAAKNLKDKTSKVAFLNKLIYLVGVCTGSEVDVRSSKIVAGSEPINTNVLLTLFGKIAVNNAIDHAAAIKHCQFGGSIEEFVARRTIDRQADDKREKDVKQSDLKGDKKSSKEGKFNEESTTEMIETSNALDRSPTSNHEAIDMDDLLQRKIQLCNGDIITTREVIEKVTTKPKCTEKLLTKPPFRFLHDLIMAINANSHLKLENVLR
jgi:hypothetical protein